MRKVLIWTCRIIVAITLIPALILAIPGGILHIITEEFIEY
jgi:hypothetical protein